LKGHRRRWEDIITDLREVVWEDAYCIYTTYGPVAGSCEHGNEPSGSVKGGELFD